MLDQLALMEFLAGVQYGKQFVLCFNLKMTEVLEEAPSHSPLTPDTKDYVYHVTLGDRLGILKEGLLPNSARGDYAWRQLERRLDEQIPEFVAVRGVSRASAVFAHVQKEFINDIFRKRSLSLKKAATHMVALQIEVDPNEAIVCDSFLLNYPYDPQTPEKYWNSAITLQQYRQHYCSRYPEGFCAIRNEEAPADLPSALYSPEVLIPGPIAPLQISWFASSAERASQHVYDFMQQQR